MDQARESPNYPASGNAVGGSQLAIGSQWHGVPEPGQQQSPMKDGKQDNWEQIRARGHGQFIVRHGILRWGVPFGLVVTFGPALYDLLAHSTVPSVWTLAGSFGFFTAGFGYGMGETEWRKREKAYHEGHLG